jgi:hypothetical protein
MSELSEAERERIVETSRRLLANPPEPYRAPAEETMLRSQRDPQPRERERRRHERGLSEATRRIDAAAAAAAQQPETDWRGWEAWVSARIDAALQAEREVMLAAVVEIVGESLGNVLGDALEAERLQWQRQLGELRTEAAKLSETTNELYRLLSIERAKVIDLPNPVQSRRDVN